MNVYTVHWYFFKCSINIEKQNHYNTRKIFIFFAYHRLFEKKKNGFNFQFRDWLSVEN